MTLKERREVYMATHGADEQDDAVDFEAPERPPEISDFRIED